MSVVARRLQASGTELTRVAQVFRLFSRKGAKAQRAAKIGWFFFAFSLRLCAFA
jgi:hypothetical protein